MVELVVSKKAEKSLAEFKPINNTIVVEILNGNTKTTVIMNYAPVEASEDTQKHYEIL